MLVDLGAGTTTVSIYYKNILRHMATIPLGGLNITKDISAFHIDEADAERLKLKHALAYVNASEVDAETKLSIDIQRTISQREFLSMAEARTEEIIKNALAQIPTEYEDKLIGGIILTGGMANMRNIEQAFRIYSKCENIRIANKVKTSVNYAKQVTNTSDISCTALSLLLKADELSSGRSLDEISIFSEPEESEPVVEQPRPRELKPGEVPTGREREQTEREAAAKAEQKKPGDVGPEEEEEKAQGRSFFSKMKDNAMKVVKKLIEEEEDER
jgi:cell division protein FtsA